MAALRNGSKCSHTTVYAPLFRRSAFAENLRFRDKREVPPSGGALNPDLNFEIASRVATQEYVLIKWLSVSDD